MPIGAGVDGAAFDAQKQLTFASGGDATLTDVREQGPDELGKFEVLVVEP